MQGLVKDGSYLAVKLKSETERCARVDSRINLSSSGMLWLILSFDIHRQA